MLFFGKRLVLLVVLVLNSMLLLWFLGMIASLMFVDIANNSIPFLIFSDISFRIGFFIRFIQFLLFRTWEFSIPENVWRTERVYFGQRGDEIDIFLDIFDNVSELIHKNSRFLTGRTFFLDEVSDLIANLLNSVNFLNLLEILFDLHVDFKKLNVFLNFLVITC